jgi:hypothetical protein
MEGALSVSSEVATEQSPDRKSSWWGKGIILGVDIAKPRLSPTLPIA